MQVSELPRTRSGKSMEIAVTQIVNGREVPNRMVVANPASLDEIAAAAGRP
jgi:acetoacetyl-CoA synthetase